MGALRDDLGSTLEEGFYLVIGLAVLGLQRARSRARELEGAPLPDRLAGVGAAAAEPLTEPLRALFERARAKDPGGRRSGG